MKYMPAYSTITRWLMCILSAITLTPCIAASYTSEDYAFMWWPYGFRGLSPQGDQVLCVQTGRYGFAFNVNKATLSNLGPIDNPLPYAETVAQDNSAVFSQPKPEFEMTVNVDGTRYTAVRAAADLAAPDYPIRMIDSGRFVQRFDIQQLEFANVKGERLAADGRVEFIAWPDRLTVICEITPKADLSDASISISLDGRSAQSRTMTLAAGQRSSVSLAWAPDEDSLTNEYRKEVSVTDMKLPSASLPIRYDPIGGFYRIVMPTSSFVNWEEPDRLDRYHLKLDNPTDKEQVFRLFFSYDKAADGTGPILPGIVGMSPMLRDMNGNPSGIPVQISKNWHAVAGRPLLYEGGWFHGYSLVRVAPRSTWEGEYDMAYARWGGVPAVSHAQLCLIGYAMNQIWDEMAIGNWGESICYDPDVNLQRSMIDDVRPLFSSTHGNPQWGFGNNVGGGDFLVYYDEANKKQFLSRMRTAYLQYGPNLTKVIYAGQSADGRISAHLTASSPRCDDINRAYYHLRYDVKKRMPFKRLAFFQIGADNYSELQAKMVARGSVDKGVIDEWETAWGGHKYLKTEIPCEGTTPWFSLHKGLFSPPKGMENQGWASRGIIIRSWKARLGGKDAPMPYAAIYGADNGVPCALLELSPTPGITELHPGDFVDAEIEMVIIPDSPTRYFGPNENLRASLKQDADTWRVVHRMAVGNSIQVKSTKGTVKQQNPVAVKTDSKGRADFTITGGVGYVPVSIMGLKQHAGYRLMIERGGTRTVVDQSVHGNDFWQTDFDPKTKTFTRTYNIPLDTPDDKPETIRLIFVP
ncbi:MAG: hypothetical protein ACYC0V_10480, partial [Armatimonadota bacterium]